MVSRHYHVIYGSHCYVLPAGPSLRADDCCLQSRSASSTYPQMKLLQRLLLPLLLLCFIYLLFVCYIIMYLVSSSICMDKRRKKPSLSSPCGSSDLTRSVCISDVSRKAKLVP